jgi:hypothetical protein
MAGPGAGALPSRPGWDGRVPEGRVDRYISIAIGCPLDGRGVGRDVPGVRYPTCYSRIGQPEKWKVQGVQGQAPGRRYVPCSSGWPASGSSLCKSFVSAITTPRRHRRPWGNWPWEAALAAGAMCCRFIHSLPTMAAACQGIPSRSPRLQRQASGL